MENGVTGETSTTTPPVEESGNLEDVHIFRM
jgi:hypothetical protein